MINLSGVEDNEGLLSRVMTTIHGPLLAGDVLVRALGYSSSEALRQASFRKMLPVTLFDIPEHATFRADFSGLLFGRIPRRRPMVFIPA